MLYTRRGDKGDTGFFRCDQRLMKSSPVVEALGAIDEANSILGICKAKAAGSDFNIVGEPLGKIIGQVQQDLFIIQAALAGAPKNITEEKIKYLENIIDAIGEELPPIKTFFLSGGTEFSALFDYTRAVARRAERRVVALSEKDSVPGEILAYLNRLSSLLYALVRISNFKSGVAEIPPSYQ